LAFSLKIPEIGINDLTVELRLTQYGVPLKLTWPRKGVKDISAFLPRETIRAFALKKAKELNYQINGSKVDFSYDEGINKFTWEFMFPNGKIDKDGGGSYHVVSINWLDTTDFSVEEIFESASY